MMTDLQVRIATTYGQTAVLLNPPIVCLNLFFLHQILVGVKPISCFKSISKQWG